ncbi:MAG: LytTR family transcriptional regulator DNA-binding domain-containing protein, partial [Acetatifactor sp.]|nr:LytTR family transcriptional regulator DNA-binding domain-containing protein [Acetatifactor sp.]
GPYLFVRANKSSIVNLKKIQSIRTYVNRRLLLTMENGEQLIASRQYAENIKRLLGVGKG